MQEGVYTMDRRRFMQNKRKNEKGFVKMSRNIGNWGWYDEPNTRSVFLHLIIFANHAPHEYRGYVIKRGQIVTGYPSLAKKLGLTVQNVRTAYNNLKSTGEITVKVTGKFSVVTLCNYELYNDQKVSDNSVSNSQANSHLTGIQQSSNNKQEEEEEKEEVFSVFDSWNRLLIKEHRSISKFRGCINGALKNYSKDEIISAMNNYKKIVDGDEFWYTHKFTLSDFLTRKNGIDCFMTINRPFATYRKTDKNFVQSDRDEDGYHKRVVL